MGDQISNDSLKHRRVKLSTHNSIHSLESSAIEIKLVSATWRQSFAPNTSDTKGIVKDLYCLEARRPLLPPLLPPLPSLAMFSHQTLETEQGTQLENMPLIQSAQISSNQEIEIADHRLRLLETGINFRDDSDRLNCTAISTATTKKSKAMSSAGEPDIVAIGEISCSSKSEHRKDCTPVRGKNVCFITTNDNKNKHNLHLATNDYFHKYKANIHINTLYNSGYTITVYSHRNNSLVNCHTSINSKHSLLYTNYGFNQHKQTNKSNAYHTETDHNTTIMSVYNPVPIYKQIYRHDFLSVAGCWCNSYLILLFLKNISLNQVLHLHIPKEENLVRLSIHEQLQQIIEPKLLPNLKCIEVPTYYQLKRYLQRQIPQQHQQIENNRKSPRNPNLQNDQNIKIQNLHKFEKQSAKFQPHQQSEYPQDQQVPQDRECITSAALILEPKKFHREKSNKFQTPLKKSNNLHCQISNKLKTPLQEPSKRHCRVLSKPHFQSPLQHRKQLSLPWVCAAVYLMQVLSSYLIVAAFDLGEYQYY